MTSAQARPYHLKLDYGKKTERIVSFATQAERLNAARAAALREQRASDLLGSLRERAARARV